MKLEIYETKITYRSSLSTLLNTIISSREYNNIGVFYIKRNIPGYYFGDKEVYTHQKYMILVWEN